MSCFTCPNCQVSHSVEPDHFPFEMDCSCGTKLTVVKEPGQSVKDFEQDNIQFVLVAYDHATYPHFSRDMFVARELKWHGYTDEQLAGKDVRELQRILNKLHWDRERLVENATPDERAQAARPVSITMPWLIWVELRHLLQADLNRLGETPNQCDLARVAEKKLRELGMPIERDGMRAEFGGKGDPAVELLYTRMQRGVQGFTPDTLSETNFDPPATNNLT